MLTILAQDAAAAATNATDHTISYFDLLVLVIMIVSGLMLWLAGGKLAKLGCIASGMIVGGLVGLVISEAVMQSGEGFYLAILTLGGAVAGAMVAGLLFRFWMAFSSAVVFGVVAPSVAMVVFAVPGPQVTHDVNAVIDWKAKARHILGESSTDDAPASDAGSSLLPDKEGIMSDVKDAIKSSGVKLDVDGDGVHLTHGEDGAGDDANARDMIHERAGQLVDAVNARGQHMLGFIGRWVRETVESQRAWWFELDASLRNRMILAALAGIIFGLVAGLLYPTFAAALQTVTVGSLLVLQPVFLLVAYYLPDQSTWLPHTWGSYVFWIIGASLVGVVMQMFVTRRAK